MSRRRVGLSPSLFPFLAVLVCTLGTLILLLALVAQEARDAAVANAEQARRQKAAGGKLLTAGGKPEALPDKPNAAPGKPNAAPGKPGLTPEIMDRDGILTAEAAERVIEEGQFRASRLISFRDAQTQDAETKRNEIAQVEAAMRDLKKQLESLKQEVETATLADPTEALMVDESTLVMMQEEIEKLRADITELESSERGKKPRVVIVPHRGPNGTQRRPVYVECTEDEIRILPEGARITKSQALAAAESENPNANPLGSALRVARRHAMQAYGDAVAPYPLIIVRPGGIRMYRIASALMKDWEDQYGYELVPGGVDLAFPGGDVVLKKELDYAIHEASARNFAFARGNGGGGRGGNGNGSGGNGSGGGGDGGYGGGGEQDDFAGEVNGNDVGSAGASSVQNNAYAQDANGIASQPSRQPDKPLPVLSAKSLDQQGISNGFAPARDQRFSGGMNRFQPPPGSSGQSYGANGEFNSQSDALNDFLAGKTSASMENESGDPSADASGQANAEGTGSGEADFAAGGENGSSSRASDRSSNKASTASSASSDSTQKARSAGSPPPGGSTAGGSTASKAIDSSATASSGSASASPPPGSTPASDSSSAPSMNFQTPPPTSPPTNLVRRDGREWAMPEAFRGMGGTEVVRPIAMVCHHDRYELMENGRVVASFPFANDGVYNSTLQLATAIRDRVSSWGATLPGGRWQPRLDVQVGPHGEQRFNEMRTLMQGSGIEINRRTP